MFFHLQYIHLFRPFLKYSPATSPLPPHVSPRRMCTANAGAISKLMRLYKKLYNLRQICNIAVYMLHSACTIHILNLPEKTAKRDIIHGVKHLEEIAEDWLCGRRTLSIISVLARKWNVELPEEASHVLQRTDEKWGTFKTSDVPSPRSHRAISPSSSAAHGVSPKVEQSPTAHHTSPAAAPSPNIGVASGVSPEILNSITSSPGSFQSDTQLAHQVIDNVSIMGNSIPLDADGLDNPSWQQPPVTQPVSSYPQSFTSAPNNARPNPASQNMRRNQHPNSIYAVDGQDWYLKDGVNWQSGFDTWNMGNATPGSSASDPSMFIFASNSPTNNSGRSLTPMEFNFENLNNLSSTEGWDLTNLE